MNDRPMPPHTPAAPDLEEGPRVWKSCLARLVINATYPEPIIVNKGDDERRSPRPHYHFWPTADLVMRIVGPSSALIWTDMSSDTEVTKLGGECSFYPRSGPIGYPPYMKMYFFSGDRMDPHNPTLPEKVDDYAFTAVLPDYVLDDMRNNVKFKGVKQFLVSAYFVWSAEEGPKQGWFGEDLVVSKLEGADWYPISEDFYV